MSQPLTISTDFAQALALATERYQQAAAQVDLTARMYSAAQQEQAAAERDVRELGRAITLVRAQQATPAAAPDLQAKITAAVSAALGADRGVPPVPTPAQKLSPAAVEAAGGDAATLAVLQQMAANPGKPTGLEPAK